VEEKMRKIFKVNPRDRKVYLGRDLAAEGYCTTGELEGYPNAFTITLLKPGASLQQAITSLKTVIQDLEARKEDGEKRQQLSKGKNKPEHNLDELRRMLKGR
jgi:uncharacterized protein Yka (UPF0111/DUF47 family)